MPEPTVDLSFSHRWRGQPLSARPLILPSRHFVYPRAVEEVERGALELLVTPASEPAAKPESNVSLTGRPGGQTLRPHLAETPPSPQPFLATCALGFRDPSVPTGLWSCPNPDELCAVAGGYAYIIDTGAPERFTMIPYRPVLQILALAADGLLLFVGHRTILAWAAHGQAWESEKLSDEGLTITGATDGVLHGAGWQMMTDKEKSFALDLKTGRLVCS